MIKRHNLSDNEDTFGLKQEPFDGEYNPGAPTTSEPKSQWAPINFPFIVMPTGLGTEMIVTDWTDGLKRHHWSCHSRKLDVNNILRHHFACTQCKQVLRDKSSAGQKSGIVPSLTFTKDESTGIFTLFTHPWEGNSANHVCNGFSVDQSDAKLLLREKLNELRVNGGPPPKQAYAELLATVDAHPEWDTAKKKRVKTEIGPYAKNERNFSRNIQLCQVSTKPKKTIKRSLVIPEQSTPFPCLPRNSTASYNEILVQNVERQIQPEEISYVENLPSTSQNEANNLKEVDFTIYCQRRVAFMYLHFGWTNEGSPQIENLILDALLKSKLIRSVEYCDWTCASATPNGSSGFRQVAVCTVRSTDAQGSNVFWPVDSNPKTRAECTQELDYVNLLNRNLPSTVRVIGWAPVHRDFNALFECQERLFTYIFPRSNFNIDAMNFACQKLIGKHDFANFFHSNQTNSNASFIYGVNSAVIEPIISDSNHQASDDLFQLLMKTDGFADNQIQSILSILFEIGVGHIQPEIIDQLFASKTMSSHINTSTFKNTLPLCIFDCTYNPALHWQFNGETLNSVIYSLQQRWADLEIKAQQIKQMLNTLNGWISPASSNGLSDFVFGASNGCRSKETDPF